MAKIKSIKENSISSRIGLEAGDEILSINEKKINDYIDYQFETSEPFFTLKIKKNSGEIKEYEVEREYNEILGITLDGIIFDGLKKCNNNCIFCFSRKNIQIKMILKVLIKVILYLL